MGLLIDRKKLAFNFPAGNVLHHISY